jgi:hypothetical protein
MQINKKNKSNVFPITVVAAVTLISLVACLCFTATRFIGSENDLNFDVEAQPTTVKVKVLVNKGNHSTQ